MPRTPILRVVDTLLGALCLVGFVIALSFVIAPLDVLSIASVPIFLLAALLGAWIAVAKPARWRIAAAILACLTTAPLAVPEIAGRVRQVYSMTAPGTGARIKVVTLNTMDGNSEWPRIVSFLSAERPDVIILQEAREEALALLQDALPDYQTRISCRFYPYCGVVILSRWPGVPLEHGALVEQGLRGEGWRTPRLRYASATLHVGAADVDVAAVHVVRNARLSFDRAQMGDLADVLADLPHPSRTILAGDFNVAASSHALAAFDRQIVLERQSYMLATWPADVMGISPFLAIDQVYAGADWRLTSIRRGTNVGSDHLSVIAQFVRR